MKKHWFNDGKICVLRETCPLGFVSGRINKSRSKVEQENIDEIENILASFSENEIKSYYFNHTTSETLSYFKIKNRKQLVKILKAINYDFSLQKVSSSKGKKSSRSHESYVLGGKKSALTQQANWKAKSEEEKADWAFKMSSSHLTENYKQVKAKQNHDRWLKLSTNEKNQINEKRSLTMKKIIKDLSEDEFENWISHKYKQFYWDDCYFDSFPELCFYLYNKLELKNNLKRSSKKIIYTFNNEMHYYFPDFELDSQLIEIKGDHLMKIMLEQKDSIEHAKYRCMLENKVKILTSKDYLFYETWFKEKNFDKKDFLNKK